MDILLSSNDVCYTPIIVCAWLAASMYAESRERRIVLTFANHT